MNEPPEFVTEVSVLASQPFHVLDAAVGRWIASEIIAYSDTYAMGLERWTRSSGSSQYALTHYGTSVWHIHLRAIELERTVIQFVVFQDTTSEVLYSRLAAFWEWFIQQLRQAAQLPPIEELEAVPQYILSADLRASIPERKRRGPAPAPHNVWAREQARLGVTIDELLPEYMRRRGQDYANENETVRQRAREVLRKTIDRARKK